MNIENVQDKKIIMEILDKLNISYITHKYFNDGVSSRVILLNDKYLIKQNTKEALNAEVEFLKLNKSDMFQEIIYVDNDYRFVVYKFIVGNVMKRVKDVDNVVQKLIDITSNYALYKEDGYGYLDEKVHTWRKFLEDEIVHSSSNVKEYIPDNTLVFECAKNLEKYKFEKKLLHGDFGTHNFIEKDGRFIGVIDPMTVSGDPLYDLLFAIVSNVDIFSKFTLEKINSLTNEPNEKVKMMLTIVLYSRISRCLKYHPKDIEIYMNFWNKYIVNI